MIVVVPEGTRGSRLASSDVLAAPPRDAACMAATLLRLGAEVRIMDVGIEQLSARVAAREARWWHADLVLFHAGGPDVVDDPLPDSRPLTALLKAQWPEAPLLLTGPLGRRYGAELLSRLAGLAGVLEGPVGPWMLGDVDLEHAPGLLTRERDQRGQAELEAPSDLPAWQLLPLDAYPGWGARKERMVSVGVAQDTEGLLAEVSHAAQRAAARFLVFDARDLGARHEATIELCRNMFAAAPGVIWSCRVKAEHMDARLALALAQGACSEVLITPSSAPEAAAQEPMDDPDREPLEAALDAARVAGLSGVAMHLVGRPGHRVPILDGWQRWFAVRCLPVRPHVRVVHAGERGPDAPDLAQALARAGCWDNELSPSDVERAVKRLSAPGAAPLGLAT
ncbi:MAG: hypothetical protein DRQ55_04185 [Planctomycetota bacterium]|nr:MAG: hypothetical protein DRQ55_04185 [Planctomycetota bacterium]